jgi:hypothetical protein
MNGRGGWWILVEGPEDLVGDTRSHLIQTIPVDGGRDQAVAQAAEVARTCRPDIYGVEDPEEYGRRVFRLAETDWLVELSRKACPEGYTFAVTWTALIRISVAELEYAHEAPAPERPAKKSKLRRGIGKD